MRLSTYTVINICAIFYMWKH